MKLHGRVFAALLVMAAMAAPAWATNYYWDTNTNTAGAGATPTGTWGTALFSLDSTGSSAIAAHTTTSSDDLFFVAGPSATSGNNAFTVTVSGTQNANTLNFQSSGAPTFTGTSSPTINLTSGINLPYLSFGSTTQGAVTFDSTVPIALQGPQVWTNLTANPTLIGAPATLTVAGLISNGTGMTFLGPGTTALTQTTSTNVLGNLIIGNPYQATGALGGSLAGNAQNSLGSGSVTVNYGGTINFGNNSATAFNPTNNVTVNAGGSVTYKFAVNGATVTPTGLLTLNNLSTLNWHSNGGIANESLNFTVGTNLAALPTAGAVFFDGNYTGANLPVFTNITGAYSPLTGTMVLGGGAAPGSANGVNNETVKFLTNMGQFSSVTGSARTLVLNGEKTIPLQADMAVKFTGGIVLNADATIKGSTNAGLLGLTPAGGSNLGTLTNDGTGRALTVTMSPIGLVQVSTPSGAGGMTGPNSVTVNSGVLALDLFNSSTTTQAFANASAITLNGGTLAMSQNSSNLQGSLIRTVTDNITVGANGGGLTVIGDQVQGTFSGSITGTNPLVLRTGGTPGASGFGSILTLSGNNSAFTGGFTLSNVGGSGNVLFSGTNSTGGAGNTITSPAGTAFGFNSLATATATIGKFSTSTESILSLTGLTGGIINLSNSGTSALNKDVRLGNTTVNGLGITLTSTTVITPFASTYRFGSRFGDISFTSANILNGANSVDFSAPAIAPGQAEAAISGTYTFTASQNLSGSVTLNGNNPNGLILLQTDAPSRPIVTLGTGGDFPSISSLSLNYRDSVVLNGTTGKISSTNSGAGLPITVQGGSTLQIGDTTAANNNGVTNRLDSGAKLTLGGSTGGGGILKLAYDASGTAAQTLASLKIDPGQSAIQTLNTAAGTLSLTITNPTITRATGSTLYLPLATANFAGVTLNGAASTSGAAANGWMFVATAGGGGGANVTAAEFAAINGSSQLVAISPTVNNINTPGADFVNSAGGTYLLSGSDNSVNTMSMNAAQAVDVGAKKLTVTTGGIVANISNLASITASGAGGLTSGFNHELIVNVVPISNGANFVISAPIVQDAGGNNINLTKLGGGFSPGPGFSGGILALQNTANKIGDVFIGGGELRVDNGAGALGVGSAGTVNANTITFENGSLAINVAGNTVFNQALNVRPVGLYSSGNTSGADNAIVLLSSTAGQSATFAGAVTLNGDLRFDANNGSAPLPSVGGSLTLSGNITGDGALVSGTNISGITNRTTTILSGSNSSWSGGADVSPWAHLRLESTTAAGTGAIAGYSGINYPNQNPTLYLGTGASGITLSQDVINLQTLVNWNTGTATETYSGAVVTTNGLTFQGNATSASAIGETVLAGKVAVDGIPQAYNWSTTPTTSVQNFVNGQGGINSGVTDYSGATQLTTTNANGQGALAIDKLGGGVVNNGALGFVRFSGANSFLPGSAGPGYIAALAKAGAGSDGEFGYLLTATASNGGATYTLPEGKGFVIGSLGSGTQVAGVLGVSGGGTATLLGGPKAAAGQLITGFTGGDVNVHANGPSDTQTLNLLARASADVLILGDATHPLVFTPTYGDSGATSAITLMAKRTGLTTYNKTGPGTVIVANVVNTNTDGTSADSQVAWKISNGTLKDGVTNALSTLGTLTIDGTSTSGTYDLNGFDQSLAGLSDAGGNSRTVTNGGAGGTNTLTITGTSTFSGVIQNGSNALIALTKSTGGTFTLGGNNTYTGLTTISGGTLAEGVNNAIASGAVTASGGTFDINGKTDTVGVFTFGGAGGGGTFAGTGGGSLTASSISVTGTGNSLSSGTLIGNATQAASSAFAVNGSLTGTDSLGGGASLSGTGSISGVVTLTGNNNSLSSSGTLSTGGLNVSGTGNAITGGTVGGGATINAGGVLSVNGSLTGNSLVSGILQGSGSTGNVTVQNGGTLKGTLTAGATTVQSGGHLAPGNSPGIDTEASLAFANGSNYDVDLANTALTAGTDYDQTVVTTGPVTVGSTAGGTVNLNLSYTTYTHTPGRQIEIINNQSAGAVDFGGASSGYFKDGATTLTEGAQFIDSGNIFKITYQGGTGNDVVLSAMRQGTIALTGIPASVSYITGGSSSFTASVANSATNDGFSATFGYSASASGTGVTGSDSGSAATGTAPAGFTIGVNNATVGTHTGAVTVTGDTYASNSPVNTNFNINVYDHSNGSWSNASDVNAFGTFNFGTVIQGSAQTTTITLYNLASLLGLTADLDLAGGDIVGTGDAAKFTGITAFSNLVTGGSGQSFLITFDTSAVGSFSGSYTLSVGDEIDLFGHTLNGTPLTIDFTGAVIVAPEPASLALLACGGFLVLGRRRRR